MEAYIIFNAASDAESPILVSGSDDGSIDLWQCSSDYTHLQHLEGKSAHDHIVSIMTFVGLPYNDRFDPLRRSHTLGHNFHRKLSITVSVHSSPVPTLLQHTGLYSWNCPRRSD